MPGKHHHTDKWRRCVDEVVGKGHDESSASAICTTSLQTAGEAIFEGLAACSEAEIKLLHADHDQKSHGGDGGGGDNKGGGDKSGSKRESGKSPTGKKLSKKQMLQEDAERVRQGKEPIHKEALNDLYKESIKKRSPTLRENSYAAWVEEEDEMRHLHLLGATGPVRYEMHNNRKHMIIPIIALMEGVIHPVNAETPEFVPLETLKKAAASWVGKPVMLQHPKRDGKQCSASDPELRASAGLGVIAKSYVEGRKMLQEVWIDDERAKKLHPEMHERLAAGATEEVSVGAYVIAEARDGEFNGKRFKAQWLETQGDHLAFLPGGRGACSCDMGCGTHRVASSLVSLHADHDQKSHGGGGGGEKDTYSGKPSNHPTIPLPDGPDNGSAVYTLKPLKGDKRSEQLAQVRKEPDGSYYGAADKFDFSAKDARAMRDKLREFGATYAGWEQRDNEANQAPVHLVTAESLEVLPVDDFTSSILQILAGKTPGQLKKDKECALCKGLGNLGGNPCEACDGEGNMKTAGVTSLAGARHSAADIKMIQTVHDHAAALGAMCSRKNLETASAISPESCGCHGEQERAAQERVRREGTRWALYSADGKRVLARHNTEADAREQLEAVNARAKSSCGCHEKHEHEHQAAAV